MIIKYLKNTKTKYKYIEINNKIFEIIVGFIKKNIIIKKNSKK